MVGTAPACSRLEFLGKRHSQASLVAVNSAWVPAGTGLLMVCVQVHVASKTRLVPSTCPDEGHRSVQKSKHLLTHSELRRYNSGQLCFGCWHAVLLCKNQAHLAARTSLDDGAGNISPQDLYLDGLSLQLSRQV